ncbi:hypothetical protein GCM10009660_05340 [Catellatospora bangladeshensis]
MIVDAILYVVDNGTKWRALPPDFTPWPTVYKRFALWKKAGASQRLLDGLRDRVRLVEGRTAPSAAIMDSQSVRAAETVGRETRGYDAGKKVAGRKQHIVVDTLGLLIVVLVTPASTQDRVAARSLLPRMRDTAPSSSETATKEWLRHKHFPSTRHYAATGGEQPWKYYDLGDGYCTYDFFAKCQHRLACARCSFYLPKQSSAGQLLSIKDGVEQMLERLTFTDDEHAALEGDRDALTTLAERLANVPTPTGPAPEQLGADRAFIALAAVQDSITGGRP